MFSPTISHLQHSSAASISPILAASADFSSINGLRTIRAFGLEQQVLQKASRRIDASANFYGLTKYITQVFRLGIDMSCALVTVCLVAAAVSGSANGRLIGPALLQIIMLPVFIASLFRKSGLSAGYLSIDTLHRFL